MVKDFAKTAESILEAVGGKENVKNVIHCITRLRFTLYNQAKASDDAVKSTPGVVNVVKAGGLYQVVIGNDVFEVYAELEKLDVPTKDSIVADNNGTKTSASLINTISGVFGPVTAGLLGIGIIKALLSILVTIFPAWVSSGDMSYVILNAAGDTMIYFFPIIIAMSASNKFGLDPIIGMIIGGVLVYPSIVELYPSGLWGIQKFFGLNILVTMRYSSMFLPSIVAVYGASKLYLKLREVLPSTIKNFFAPFGTLLVIIPFTFLVVGPIFGGIGMVIQMGITKFLGIPYIGSIIVGFIIGGFFQVLVIFGLHNVLGLIFYMELSQVNPVWQSSVTAIWPYANIAILTQAGAAFAMMAKIKNKERRSAAFAAGLSGILGTTEPIIYGFTLPKRKPFIMACISGALCGALAAFAGNFISDGHGIALQFPTLGIFALPNFLIPGFADSIMNFLIGSGASIFGIIGAFLLVFITYKPDTAELRTGIEPFIDTSKIDLIKAKKIYSPVKGRVFPLTQSVDPVHQEESVGKGVCFMPLGGKIYAPFDGKIDLVFDTKHAINIKSEDGIELLLHCGIDTVKLGGKGFVVHVREDETVSRGQLLLEYDNNVIARAGFNLETQLIVVNSGDYKAVVQAKSGDCTVGDIVLYVE
jgi:PTS system beta-glucosides-specific IIC component